MDILLKHSEEIILNAVDRYKPVAILLMFSGGHDSVVAAHVSSEILKKNHLQFEVYHGDTTIGIPETQQYVKNICHIYNWKLSIRKPPKEIWYYDNIVLKYGFPGPTKASHQLMYRLLKERALNAFVTHEKKSAPLRKENVLLITGVRKQESKIRMGYTEVTTKDRSKIWCNAIFNFSDNDIRLYMSINNIPKNPVKEKICISGECLCGAFAGKEEWTEIKHEFPDMANRINDLHKKASEKGFQWHWASGPKEWKSEESKKTQLKLNFMCSGCDAKHDFFQ